MRTLKLTILFLVINFSALGLGSFLMNNGPTETWYLNLEKAPWTPPGWVFGAAWTLIMICFSIYLSFLFNKELSKKIIIAFIIQLVLNISWNYIFFNQHFAFLGVLVLLALLISVLYFFFEFRNSVKQKNLLLLPYIIWLGVAISLNLYILIHN